MKKMASARAGIGIFLVFFPLPAHSAEFGQGGMSVVPSPLPPSQPTTPMPTAPLPPTLPGRSSQPATQTFMGGPGLSRPVISPTAARLVLRTTPPGARVSFDGIDLGRTPLNAEVPSGPNRLLVLRLNGYRPIRMKVSVEGGKILGMAFSLKPAGTPSRPRKHP